MLVDESDHSPLLFFHHLFKPFHVPLRTRHQILFINRPHDLHQECLELVFCFRGPQCLVPSPFEEGIVNCADGEFILIGLQDVFRLATGDDPLDQGKLAPMLLEREL